MASTDLPSSPAARAFFAALDGSTDGTKKKQSDLIRKRIQTLGWRNRHSQDEFYPVTVGSSQFSVLQVQRGEVEGTYGTGATVWPAAMVLLKYLERQADSLVRDKRIMDLGSGTGITSIAAACLGAKHVICTDGEPSVVQLARDNTKRATEQLGGQVVNETVEAPSSSFLINNCRIDLQEYWWGSGTVPPDVDVVIVADCVLPKLYPIAPLVEALDHLLVQPNAVAIFSYEHRYFPQYDPRDKFQELATAKNLTVQVVPLEEQDPVYSVEDIEIWRVQRK